MELLARRIACNRYVVGADLALIGSTDDRSASRAAERRLAVADGIAASVLREGPVDRSGPTAVGLSAVLAWGRDDWRL